jgi:hypothetical protein
MSRPQDPLDDLQRIWQEDLVQPEREDTSMIVRLVQEKQRSLQDLVRGQNLAEYILALGFAPLTALAAWIVAEPLIQLGYLILTVTLVAGTVVMWVSERRTRTTHQFDLSVRENQRLLLHSYDRRIRLLRSVKYWYAMPLFFGASLVLIPIALRTLPGLWGILLPFGLMLGAWIAIWHMNDVRRVGDLQQRKDEVQRLLDEMDRE